MRWRECKGQEVERRRGVHKDERSREGNKVEEEVREQGHKASKGKTMRSQKDLRNDCETISF